jgi:hypothetical protein
MSEGRNRSVPENENPKPQIPTPNQKIGIGFGAWDLGFGI